MSEPDALLGTVLERGSDGAILIFVGTGGVESYETPLFPDGSARRALPWRKVDSELQRLRKASGLVEIALIVVPVSAALARRAAGAKGANEADLGALVEQHGPTLVYVVGKANEGPAGVHTVAVGGDCHRGERTIEEAIGRIAQLASEMERKAVSVFPDRFALHGGKKGEFLVFDRFGRKLDLEPVGPVTAAAMVALAAPAVACLIDALNTRRAAASAIWKGRLPQGAVRPESASPDVFTGKVWPDFVGAFERWGLDEGMFTCPLPERGGFSFPSASPTGLGVAVGAADLLDALRVPRHEARVLVEAAGLVTQYCVPALIERGIRAENISVFDPNPAQLEAVSGIVADVTTVVASDAQAYAGALSGRFDLLVVNGLGNRIGPSQAARIASLGVRGITGGANTLLSGDGREETVRWLHAHGVEVLPSYLVNGGGWAGAVLGQVGRAQGVELASIADRVFATVIGAVQDLVRESIVRAERDTSSLWHAAAAIIDTRVSQSRANHLEGDELRAAIHAGNLLRTEGG